MKRLLSGIQPTGELHIGNYLGAVKQWVEFQNDYDAFFMVADYHTLTIKPKPEDMQRQALDLVAMLIALGIDPKSSTLFIQSHIPAHTELCWIFSCFSTIGQLNRMTQYKDKSDKHGQTTGLLTYPILQAADIALYGGEVVPIGQDQVQHLELSREIIRSFNSHIGKGILIEPKPLLTTAARIMGLNDPSKKMSKSIAGSAISLLATDVEVAQTIKSAVTDSDPNSSELSPGIKNIFDILGGLGDASSVEKFEKMRKEGKLRYSELKEELIEVTISFLRPVQKTYQTLRADEMLLHSIIDEGRTKAEPVAAKKLKEVKDSLGLIS